MADPQPAGLAARRACQRGERPSTASRVAGDDDGRRPVDGGDVDRARPPSRRARTSSSAACTDDHRARPASACMSRPRAATSARRRPATARRRRARRPARRRSGRSTRSGRSPSASAAGTAPPRRRTAPAGCSRSGPAARPRRSPARSEQHAQRRRSGSGSSAAQHLVERAGEHRERGRQLPAHAGPLAALAGEQERRPGRARRRRRAARRRRVPRRPARPGRPQRRRSPSVGDHDRPVRERARVVGQRRTPTSAGRPGRGVGQRPRQPRGLPGSAASPAPDSTQTTGAAAVAVVLAGSAASADGRPGPSASTTWQLVPPMPNELTPASSGRVRPGQAPRLGAAPAGPARRAGCAGWGSRSCRLGGSCRCRMLSAALSSPTMPPRPPGGRRWSSPNRPAAARPPARPCRARRRARPPRSGRRAGCRCRAARRTARRRVDAARCAGAGRSTLSCAGRAGHGQPVGRAVVVDGAAADHAVDRVAVGERAGQRLEHDQRRRPRRGRSRWRARRRCSTGRPATAPPNRADADRALRHDVQVHPAGEGQRGLAAAQALAGQVHGDQRGRLGGVDGQARARAGRACTRRGWR